MEFLLIVAACFWASWQIERWEREVEEARKVSAHRSLFRD